MTNARIKAVAFDCYGTLIEFGDAQFARAYETICANQGLVVDGKVFYDKWMEVWRRLAADGRTTDAGTVAVGDHRSHLNTPGPLSEAEPIPPHPEHHTPSAGRVRAVNGPPPPFRPYRDEWPEHFAICFEELELRGDPRLAYEQLRDLIAAAGAFPETRRVVDAVGRRLPTAVMSNADDDFLVPCLARNGLAFPVTLSSEGCRAYKPHVAIFEALADGLGLAKQEILYVGDSRFADIAGAKNAGMLAAWVNRPGVKPIESTAPGANQNARADLPAPDFEIDSLDALLKIVPALSGAEGEAPR